MRKLAIIAAIIIWIAAISKLNNSTTDSKVLSAFDTYDIIDDTATEIEGFRCISNTFASTKDREEYLSGLATHLEVREGTVKTTRADGRTITTYEKISANGTLNMRLVSTDADPDSYLFVTLDIGENASYAFTYQSIIKSFCDDVTITIKGDINGYLDYTSKCILADTFMRKIGATIVSENRTDELFVVYGYTRQIDDCIKILGEPINVSLSIEYDENTDTTHVHIATPVETFAN